MSATRESARALYKALGCSDGGCPFRPRGGMRTNAGCRCHEIIEDALTRERTAACAEAEKALLRRDHWVYEEVRP